MAKMKGDGNCESEKTRIPSKPNLKGDRGGVIRMTSSAVVFTVYGLRFTVTETQQDRGLPARQGDLHRNYRKGARESRCVCVCEYEDYRRITNHRGFNGNLHSISTNIHK
jgi:hypothetical protein